VTFVTSESISTLAVDLLSAELSLTQTVSQVPSGDVAPPTGGETTLRVPVPREAKIQPRGANLDYTEIDEIPVDFSIDHIYDGARVTEHQRSLDIVDFGRQVTRNQVRAVVAGAERQLASVMNALPIDEEVTPDGSDFDNVIADANALLDEAENPMENRWLAVSPRFAARLTSPDGVTLTDFQGEVATEALRQGILGEYRGFIVVKSPRLTGIKALAYHSSAFAFGTLTPPMIPGTIDSAVITEEGLSVRHVFMVDPSTASTLSLLSIYAGAELVDADRVVVLGVEDES